MPRVSGLGHLGIYVRDIERMNRVLTRDFLGMQVTKQDPDGRMMFLSSDPESVDHEIALMTGRSADDGPPLIQQISLRVPSLDDLRTFHPQPEGTGGTRSIRLSRTSAQLAATSSILKAIAPKFSGLPACRHGSWSAFRSTSNGPTPRSWPTSTKIWQQTRHVAHG